AVLALACLEGWVAFRALQFFVPEAAALALSVETRRTRLQTVAELLFTATGAAHRETISTAFNRACWIDILRSTTIGSAAVSRPIVCLLLVTAIPIVPGRLFRVAGEIALFAALCLTFPLTGHAAADGGDRWLAILSHLVHIAASSIWF